MIISEENAPHPPSHPLLLINLHGFCQRAWTWWKIVLALPCWICWRTGWGCWQTSWQSQAGPWEPRRCTGKVVSHLCDKHIEKIDWKFENLCVELRPEPARLQHRQAMGKSANLQNISKSGLTIKCCRLYEYARFCTCLMISWLWGSSPFSTARTYSKTSLTLGSTIRCWTGRERSLRLTHPACQHLNCWMLGHEVIRSPEEKTN